MEKKTRTLLTEGRLQVCLVLEESGMLNAKTMNSWFMKRLWCMATHMAAYDKVMNGYQYSLLSLKLRSRS